MTFKQWMRHLRNWFLGLTLRDKPKYGLYWITQFPLLPKEKYHHWIGFTRSNRYICLDCGAEKQGEEK